MDAANIGGTNGIPPGPCNVQIGLVNSAGVTVKSANGTILPGHAAFLTINYSEPAASTTPMDGSGRHNFRPVVATMQPALSALPPDPCRTVSTAEVFDALLGRTHAFAIASESPLQHTRRTSA